MPNTEQTQPETDAALAALMQPVSTETVTESPVDDLASLMASAETQPEPVPEAPAVRPTLDMTQTVAAFLATSNLSTETSLADFAAAMKAAGKPAKVGRPKKEKAEGETTARVTKGATWITEGADLSDTTRFEGETNGAYCRRLLLSGVYAPQTILKHVHAAFPGANTSISSIRFYYEKIKEDPRMKPWKTLSAIVEAPVAAQ